MQTLSESKLILWNSISVEEEGLRFDSLKINLVLVEEEIL